MTEAHPLTLDRSSLDKILDRGSAVTTVPPQDDVMSMTDSHYSSVLGLRDRLLREARSERAAYEQAPAQPPYGAAARPALREFGVQTEPVVIADSAVDAVSSTTPALAASGGWTAEDEAAQAEALRTIALLGQGGPGPSAAADGRVVELEEQVRAERASRQELEVQVAHERSRKDAAQQQVLCLEQELDGKEEALRAAETELERQRLDLHKAQMQLRSLQEGGGSLSMAATYSSGSGMEDLRLVGLKAQLNERDRQLELKDQHITRLLNVLQQHRSLIDSA